MIDSAPNVGDPGLAVPFTPTYREETRGKLQVEQMCFGGGKVSHFRSECQVPPRCHTVHEFLRMDEGGSTT